MGQLLSIEAYHFVCDIRDSQDGEDVDIGLVGRNAVWTCSNFQRFFIYIFILNLPNVAAESLALLLRILDVPGTYFGFETGYPILSVSRFFSVTPGKCLYISPLPFMSFAINCLLVMLPSELLLRAADSIVK